MKSIDELYPCIHGPGVENCGHPDCVGAREYYEYTKMMQSDGWEYHPSCGCDKCQCWRFGEIWDHRSAF